MSKKKSPRGTPEINTDIEDEEDYLDFRKKTERAYFDLAKEEYKQEEKRRQEAASWNKIVNVAMFGNLIIFATYQVIKISKEIL
jgi:hypothetical protein